MSSLTVKSITENISYIEPTESPLSANVVMIKGEDFLWLYDVGAHPKVPEIVGNATKGENSSGIGVKVILSHFHPDHMGNIGKIGYEELFVGANTYKYTKTGSVVDEDVWITDGGLRLHIFPFPSSHAKGSLALEVNEEYLFLGDALYPTKKSGKTVVNAGLLQEQIKLLERLKADKLFLSHAEPFMKEKAAVLNNLKAFYTRREKNSPYIEVTETLI